MAYWLLKHVLLGPVLRAVWRPWITGAENIPDDGPVILASNHLSFSDSFFLPLMVRRRVTFLAKAEYFTTPGLRGLFSRVFFSAAGQVPIDRGDADAAAAALETGVRLLRRGAVLGIYPEGTRSPDGRLYRGKTGVARMALASGAVVVPCAMIGTERVQPTGRLIPRLRPRPGIRVGRPIEVAHRGVAGDRFAERSITDEIMYELMTLSGQEYVDVYAATVKARTGAPAGFGARHGVAHADAVHLAAGRQELMEAADRLPTERAG